jgi:hypothetical protein
MLKKSLEQIVSDDPETEREGAFRALVHATGMRDRGYFSPDELRGLRRVFAQVYRDTMSSDEFDARQRDGSYSQLDEMCGYTDNESEDSDAADLRCRGLAVQVIASFFAEAARAGLVESRVALQEIGKYASLPAGEDADGVIGAVLDMLARGQRLPLAGERQTSDEEIDAALDGMKDRRGDSMMRRVRERGPTQDDVDAMLDAATDSRGRPMFPREVAEEDGEPVTRTFRGPKAPAEAMGFMLRQLSRRRK